MNNGGAIDRQGKATGLTGEAARPLCVSLAAGNPERFQHRGTERAFMSLPQIRVSVFNSERKR